MRVGRLEALKIVKDGTHRFNESLARFREVFEREPSVIVSAPGRSEIIGNHTDHNNGRVVAAAIDLDTLVLAAPSESGVSRLVSKGWDSVFSVDPGQDRSSDGSDTERLMRGVAVGLERAGYAAPAYDAVLDSRVLPGSGLSSSAALEMSLSGIHEALSGTDVPPVERARIGRYAENEYIHKPCGLMDQMAASIGGCVAIDFSGAEDVRYHPLALDFRRTNHQLAIVDTGGSHANLTDQYAAIPREMKALAAVLGAETLAETSRSALLSALIRARQEVGDRAVLRGFHFFDEQDRVSALIDAVDRRHDDLVLSLMRESGESSWTLLQNINPAGESRDQSLALALTLTREYFHTRGAVGAYRVHGGGFAGTILAVVPAGLFEEYRSLMDRTFGKHATQELAIRGEGVIYADLRRG